MAQQLYAVNQQIALLTLIDTPEVTQIPLSMLKSDDADILADLLKANKNTTISSEKIRQLNSNEQLNLFLTHGEVGNNEQMIQMTLEQFSRYIHIHKVNYKALQNYVPKRYSGKIIFFKAAEWDGVNLQHAECGWCRLAAEGLEIYEVSGNHITMNYLPHVEVIAKRLTVYLNSSN
jgi:thioesterase domain-containing protein